MPRDVCLRVYLNLGQVEDQRQGLSSNF